MRPKLRLSRLRDIGWRLWDPIGLLGRGESWDGKPFADEYDAYLIEAAGRLRRGVPAADVVAYLCRIEADHMGLGAMSGREERAAAVVDAIQADESLWSDPAEKSPDNKP